MFVCICQWKKDPLSGGAGEHMAPLTPGPGDPSHANDVRVISFVAGNEAASL